MKREPLLSGTSNDVALVIDSGDLAESGLDTEDGVEGVGLGTSLRWLTVRSSAGSLAGVLRGLVGTTAVGQSITNELSDDVNVLGRAVVVRS